MYFLSDSAGSEIISFPGLGIDGMNPDPVAFTLFGKFEVRWYGLLIALGMLLAVVYAYKRCKLLGLSFDQVIDGFLWAVPMAIIFARLYYCLFYTDASGHNPYFSNPLSILEIWNGGLAIYGGVIGAAVGLLINAKARKKGNRQKLLPYFDIMALGLPIGQCIGRWGNFFNREAYGAEITGNWFLRMGLTPANAGIAAGPVHFWHPTFLYESVWNLLVFFALHFLTKKRKYDGHIFLWYLCLYGLGRSVIEGLRTDSLYIGSIRVSQLLAIACVVVSAAVMLYIRLKLKPSPENMLVNQVKTVPCDSSSQECGDLAAEVSDADQLPENPIHDEEEIQKTPENNTLPETNDEEL